MGIIILISVLVLVVSLYDYFSSKNWQQVTSTARNELVFEDRNQEYGAYQIRSNYNRNLILIMLGIIATIGLAYGTYIGIKAIPADEVEAPPIDTTAFTIEAPPIDEDEVPPPPPPVEEVPMLEKSVAFLPPVVTDKEVDNTLPPQDAMTDTKASSVNNDKETESFTPPPVVTAPPKVEEKPEEVLTFVEEDASFPGGHAAMMKFLQQNMKYPEIAIQAGIEGKVQVRFVVEKDGQISNVKVQKGVPGCPECDKEAIRVIKMMPKWAPGKNGGTAVRSYFNMPVVFKLQ